MSAADDRATPGAPSIPELLSGAAVVALVPATADLDGAAALAWGFARCAAMAGRRVALVDCYVDEPQLNVAAGDANQEGIVDVFEYGASLSRIAQAQPEPSLFFVPAGTYAPDPAALMANPRWRRLATGFRHVDAVMLLFLPAECIGALAADLDGIVALAPSGAEAGLASTPEIQASMDRGVPLLATMTDTEGAVAERFAAAAAAPSLEPADAVVSSGEAEVEPAAPAEEPALQLAVPIGRHSDLPGARGFRARWAVYGVLLSLAAAAAALNYRKALGLGDLGLSRFGLGSRILGALGPAEERESLLPSRLPAPGYLRLVPHAVDTLPLAIQVSSWTTLAGAMEAGDILEGRGFSPIVSPFRLGRRIWYRVLAGPVATRNGADVLLGAVRAAGLDRPGTAASTLVPLSFALRRVASPAVARTERARLRAVGIPAFVLGQGDGSYRLFAGAFGAPAQAVYLDSLLTSTIGSAGQLGPRVGFRP
jgi:hypothetical protein